MTPISLFLLFFMQDGKNALLIALWRCREPIAKMLIEHGVNVSHADMVTLV